MKATLVDSEMPTWAPDTRHYVTSDGRHLAIHVHDGLDEKMTALVDAALAALEVPTLASGVYAVAVSPTTVLECTEDGLPTTLTPLYTFPPGTTHEQALAQIEQE